LPILAYALFATASETQPLALEQFLQSLEIAIGFERNAQSTMTDHVKTITPE
jgi:hypothetical protein